MTAAGGSLGLVRLSWKEGAVLAAAALTWARRRNFPRVLSSKWVRFILSALGTVAASVGSSLTGQLCFLEHAGGRQQIHKSLCQGFAPMLTNQWSETARGRKRRGLGGWGLSGDLEHMGYPALSDAGGF